MDLDEALKQIATYQYGQSRKNLIAVGNEVRDSFGNSDRRKKIRRQLAALLGSDATSDCKRFVCEQLSIIGSTEEVPALSKLLTDEDLSHMARFALERIPGSAADAALRDALSKTKGETLVGIVNSLGERRDHDAAEDLIKLMVDTDVTVAVPAAAALGKIGGPDVVNALARAKAESPSRVRSTIVDALLQCAEDLLSQGKKNDAVRIYQDLCLLDEAKQVREAALRGLKASGEK
jgi:HEAT repeat protein